MSVAQVPLGRRERNKQAKLERIIAAAAELFAERGIDEVTTQEIADAADIGAGTLFLYAKNKGELLLLAQNANYATALSSGRAAAAAETTATDALVALVRPVVECNRAQRSNGRTYLREMIFGDASEPRRAAALAISAETMDVAVGILTDRAGLALDQATILGRVISAVVITTMAAPDLLDSGAEEVVAAIRGQLEAIVPQ